MNYYVRFGDIPEDEESTVWFNDEMVRKEKGVSVYHAIVDECGNVSVALTFPVTKTTLYTFQYLIEYDKRPCYLVTGDCVGRGEDNEPLLKNVKIIREIEFRKKN